MEAHGLKIMLFPGAFSPPHFGHMKLLLQAIEHVRPNVTLVLPVWRSDCAERDRVDPWYRRNMVREAVNNALPLPIAEMVDTDSHCELKDENPALTYQLVRHYQETYPGAELWILLGPEGAATTKTWEHKEEIAQETRIIVARGVKTESIPGFAVFGLPKKAKPSPITATKCRGLIREGKSTWRYIPRRVARIVEENGFYGAGRPEWATK